MKKYLATQIFTIAILVILVTIFYMILLAGASVGFSDFLTPAILVVIAVICLGIFSTLTKIEYKIRKR